jgi:mannose-6-phosphate isomerase-like protein (cupin superfamily)
MRIEVLRPTCNLDTVRDGRGGIFTWVPPEPIVEFNLVHIRPGKVRGMHYHEHFVEYLLVVAGTGVLITKDDHRDPDCPEEFVHLNPGTCTRTPIGVVHTVQAVSDLSFIAMLTKKWDDSHPPIVQVGTLPHLRD